MLKPRKSSSTDTILVGGTLSNTGAAKEVPMASSTFSYKGGDIKASLRSSNEIKKLIRAIRIGIEGAWREGTGRCVRRANDSVSPAQCKLMPALESPLYRDYGVSGLSLSSTWRSNTPFH